MERIAKFVQIADIVFKQIVHWIFLQRFAPFRQHSVLNAFSKLNLRKVRL